MAASVSVACAIITLAALENSALSSYKTASKSFVQYANGCFCVIHREDVMPFLAHLNSCAPSIQLTMEHENNGQTDILDTVIRRSAKRIITSVYRKPTHTGNLGFDSAHPLRQKQSVAAALFSRALRICIESGLRKQELAVVRKDLCSNGYSSQLLKTQQLRFSVAYLEEVREDERKRVAVAYLQGISEALASVVGTHSVKISFVPTNRLEQKLVRAKDPLEK